MGISAFADKGFLQPSQKLRGFTNDNPFGSLKVKRFIKLPRDTPIKKRLTTVKRFKFSILFFPLTIYVNQKIILLSFVTQTNDIL